MYRRILGGTDGSPSAAMSETSCFLLGPVPDEVSHHTPCPPLIVHTT